MKQLFTAIFILSAAPNFAQTPQIAHVSSDGTTTTIYTAILKKLN